MKRKNPSVLLFLTLIIILSSCKSVPSETEPVPRETIREEENEIVTEEESENNPEAEASTDAIKQEESIEADDKTPADTDYSELSNETHGFGYRKEDKGIVPSIGIYANYFEGMNAYYIGNTESKKIYLTFDEGYENGYTAQILDVLKEKKVSAAFFCTGDYLKNNDELVSRMINEGHIVGNHTWNHPSMPGITDDEQFKKELKSIDDYLYEKHKIKTKFFRYPNGEFSERTLAMIKDMGYTTVFWSLAYRDWEQNVSNGKDYAFAQVDEHIHNGAIILLHAVSKDNADALDSIIDALKNENYEFASLNEL